MLFRRILVLVAIFSFLGAGFPGARPVYGFSVGDEREMGEKLLSVVRQQFKLLDEPDIAQYIQRLGREIVAVSGPQYFDYHFFVIRNKELNAFAAPSGLIFFHSGLVEAMETENELVSVVAHEVAHATRRHLASRLEKAKKVNIGTMAMVLAGIVVGSGELSEALITGSLAANASLGLKFSRADEEEADRLAVKWMQEDRRDPIGMVAMLREMRRINRFRSGNLPPYLLTHPEPGIRMGYVQDIVLFGPKKDYQPVDEFEFGRFRQRVISITGDTRKLIPQYLGKLSRGRGSDFDKAMTEYGLALCYARNAEFDKAFEYLGKVIKRYPGKIELKADLGVLYYEAGQHSEALRLFREVSSAAPDNAYALYYLAKTLQRTGDSAQAVNIYEELLAALPDFSRLYYELGMIKAEQGEQGIGYYYLGVFQWYEGNVKLAKSNLGSAMAKLPDGDRFKAKAKELLAKIKRLEKK